MLNKAKIKEFIKKRPAISMGGIVILGLFIWALLSQLTGDEAESSIEKYAIKEGPLKISVTETGTIQPKDKVIVNNKVEGQTTITYIVDEGSTVKKGDLMVQLDSSTLSDKLVDQEIQVQKAEASNIAATENYEVTKNQAQSDIEAAKLAYEFAELDLKKYIEGEYPDKLREAESNITVAEQEAVQAKDTLEWSKKLYEEGYLSQAELEKDTLSYTRKQLAVDLKKEAKELLINFTHKRQLSKLQSDVSQTKASLERTTRKSKASIAQAGAKKAAMQAEYERQVAKLEKYKNQLGYTKVYAPTDGKIIYATSAEQSSRWHSHNQPLKVGVSVQERQELIHLPSTSGFSVTLSIPESSIEKIKVGLPALVTVDSIPNVIYTGTVTSIANVVNAQAIFSNSDIKVYDTVVTLENGGNMDLLRTGLSCSAEIIIDQYEKAIYVPIQAVISVGEKPTVYVVKGDKMKPRTVETGLDNDTVIRIASGLEPGETISLNPPLSQAKIEETIIKFPESLTAPDAGNTPDPASSENKQASDSTKENKKDSGNRYSTTGSIDDSSSSGGEMSGGGMGGGMGGGGMGGGRF
jgi:HlyD family secretion protein